ncbi:MAG: hypothetical protein WEE51_06950 [Pirellulaceae bacterium]
MRYRNWQTEAPLPRRLVAWLLLPCLLAIGTGVSIPTAPATLSHEKDLSQPFPCQHSRCGCRDAASCWQKCCCHTDREKLAWAAKNGVTPPAFVIQRAQAEAPTKPLIFPAEFCCSKTFAQPQRSGCGGCSGDSCESPPVIVAEPAEKLCCGDQPKNEEPSSPASRLSLANALQCQGLDSVTMFYAPICPPLSSCALWDLPTQDPLCIAAIRCPLSWLSPPDTPPPRPRPTLS